MHFPLNKEIAMVPEIFIHMGFNLRIFVQILSDTSIELVIITCILEKQTNQLIFFFNLNNFAPQTTNSSIERNVFIPPTTKIDTHEK